MALKWTEIKTNASVSFTRALLAKTEENGLEIEKNWQRSYVLTWCIPKIPQMLIWITFPGKIPLILPFWFKRNVESYETTTKFVWFFYQLWPENSKTTVTLPLYFHNNHNLKVEVAMHSNGGTPFFDVTLTIDRFPSNAKVTFTKSLRKCELTLRISKASQVSL